MRKVKEHASYEEGEPREKTKGKVYPLFSAVSIRRRHLRVRPIRVILLRIILKVRHDD
jgi:hypothetical protein